MIDDDAIDADIDVTARAFDEFPGFEYRQIFGECDRQHQCSFPVVYERFDPARMTGEGTRANGMLNDTRYIEKSESVPRRRRVDDQEIVERLSGRVRLLFQMPDLSEDDELPPTRCGLEELLKGFGLEHTVRHRAEVNLDSRVVGQCFMRIDMHRMKPRSEFSAGVAEWFW